MNEFEVEVGMTVVSKLSEHRVVKTRREGGWLVIVITKTKSGMNFTWNRSEFFENFKPKEEKEPTMKFWTFVDKATEDRPSMAFTRFSQEEADTYFGQLPVDSWPDLVVHVENSYARTMTAKEYFDEWWDR
jgi:hypothetical protein